MSGNKESGYTPTYDPLKFDRSKLQGRCSQEVRLTQRGRAGQDRHTSWFAMAFFGTEPWRVLRATFERIQQLADPRQGSRLSPKPREFCADGFRPGRRCVWSRWQYPLPFRSVQGDVWFQSNEPRLAPRRLVPFWMVPSGIPLKFHATKVRLRALRPLGPHLLECVGDRVGPNALSKLELLRRAQLPHSNNLKPNSPRFRLH